MIASQPAVAALNVRAKHAWVRATVWSPFRVSSRVPVTVLVDSGAGGGNYASETFIGTVQSTLPGKEQKSIIAPVGRVYLRAANPQTSNTPPMKVIGTCILPLVFKRVDRVFQVTARVVTGLPYAIVIGTAFLWEYHSVLSFNEAEGFKPTPGLPWVQLIGPNPESQPSPLEYSETGISFA